ncbi:MAG: LacI family DNA-binding transcriptional regulator [Lewinella sp.]
MKRKPSLKDIAKEVGVSIPLVSYVLSDKGKENRVSEQTAKRIREVAAAMNYQPNLNARSLKTNKTRTIGLIVADISNPFFATLARVIEDEAYTRNYTVIFGSSDENVDKFEKVLRFLETRQVDGFIIAAPDGSEAMLRQLWDNTTPLVLVDRYFKGFDAPHVIVDNFNASVQATNYLIGKGHERIACICYQSNLDHYADRRRGFVTAMKDHGVATAENLVTEVSHVSLKSDMKEAIRTIIVQENIRAIYFQTNTLAEEGLRQLMNLGRDLLNETDVVVFDQNSTYHFLENFIPYMKQPIKRMGQKSVEILIDQIEKADKEVVGHEFETKLKAGKAVPEEG